MTPLEHNLRYIDLMFECSHRASRIVNRVMGWEGPHFPDDDFSTITPRRAMWRAVYRRLLNKQCEREGVRYHPTYYDLLKYPELGDTQGDIT